MRRDTEVIPDRLDGWAQLDGILPEQFSAEVHALGDPERRLRLAVLEDAIRYFERYGDATGGRARTLYEDAADWFTSPDRSEPFAFENVCDALEIDPDYIRQGLARWRLARYAGRPGASLPRFVSRRTPPRWRVRPRRAA